MGSKVVTVVPRIFSESCITAHHDDFICRAVRKIYFRCLFVFTCQIMIPSPETSERKPLQDDLADDVWPNRCSLQKELRSALEGHTFLPSNLEDIICDYWSDLERLELAVPTDKFSNPEKKFLENIWYYSPAPFCGTWKWMVFIHLLFFIRFFVLRFDESDRALVETCRIITVFLGVCLIPSSFQHTRSASEKFCVFLMILWFIAMTAGFFSRVQDFKLFIFSWVPLVC